MQLGSAVPIPPLSALEFRRDRLAAALAGILAASCSPTTTLDLRLRDAARVHWTGLDDVDARGAVGEVDLHRQGALRRALPAPGSVDDLKVTTGDGESTHVRLYAIDARAGLLDASIGDDIGRGKISHYVTRHLETPASNVVDLRLHHEAFRLTGAAFLGFGLAAGGLFGAPLLAAGVTRSTDLSSSGTRLSPSAAVGVGVAGGLLLAGSLFLLADGLYLLVYPTHDDVLYSAPR